VLETTRLGIEVKNLKMRVESLTSRLEFNERRARALESVVAYRPAPEDRIEQAPPVLRSEEPALAREVPAQPQVATPTGTAPGLEGPGQRSRRRRRRRGRRGGGSATVLMGGAGAPADGGPTTAAPRSGHEMHGEPETISPEAPSFDPQGDEDDSDVDDREP
jgi:hypothetical protein